MKRRSKVRACLPAAVTVVVGSHTLVAATLGCDLLRLSPHAAVIVLALVAGAVSVGARPGPAAYLGVVSFALFDGFVQDQERMLSFGGDDIAWFGALVLVPVAVAELTRVVRSRWG